MVTFWKLNGSDFLTVQSLAGCLYFLAVNQTMMHFMDTLIVFQIERPVFLRE